jgi:hypothetical protein
VYSTTTNNELISWPPCCAPLPRAPIPDPREAQVLLESLVRIQKPASYYATTVVRDAGRPEVHLAFEDKGDAQKLAGALEAEATSNYPGWATERTFDLDSATVAALAASLPLPKTRPKPPPAGPPASRRIGRGAKIPITRYD